ncbi:MAG: metallophosphoesterase [Myxococcota bacterium]|nr:metallophosphoesterase [Myxococcota bacterium]
MRRARLGRLLAPAGVVLVLAAVLCAGSAEAAAFTRRPTLNSVDQDSAIVVLRLDASCSVTVRYGAGTDLGQSASGTASGANHAVTLSGLTAGTRYSYQVEACGSKLGDVDTFRTAPSASTMQVHFAAVGDMGTGGSMQTNVSNRMHQAAPELWLGLGDLAYADGTDAEFTSNFFKPMGEAMEDIPFFPSPGNHEYYTGQAQPYLDAFVLPTNNPASSERYYSFDWGPVHFVSLDGECVADYEASDCDDVPQLAWLKADLAATTKPWKVVFFHRPSWSSGEHGSNLKMRERLSPILEQYDVDLALTGHDHHYERTHPITGDAVDAQNGITYLVVGGGGANLRTFGVAQPSWSVYRNATDYGFLDVVVDGGTLTGKFVRHDGQVLDTFTLSKQVTTPKEFTLTVAAEPAQGTVPFQTLLGAQTNLSNPDYLWTLPDGSNASGAQVPLELTEPGSYAISVTATGEGTSISKSITVAANAPDCEATNSCFVPDAGNEPEPTPDAGGPGPGPGPDDGWNGGEGGAGTCGGGGAAMLFPFAVAGLVIRRRRAAQSRV